MTLAGRWACSRLQIELVIVESDESPSLRKSHLLEQRPSFTCKAMRAADMRLRHGCAESAMMCSILMLKVVFEIGAARKSDDCR